MEVYMEFKEFRNKLQKHFNKMANGARNLFIVDVDKDELWNFYLDCFPPGTNEIYRERRKYDCSCCCQFIKEIGSVVSIKDGTVTTIWDLSLKDDTYQPVADALAEFIRHKPIRDLYVGKNEYVGTEYNFEIKPGKRPVQWEHFYLALPKKFVKKSSDTVAGVQGAFRDTANVFRRSLEEISEESVVTVLELIAQGSLYRGEEWKKVLATFHQYKKEYAKLKPDSAKELYVWQKSGEAGDVTGRIRNHSIGALLIDISENVPLDEAVRKYEKIVAPQNYKRPKPIFTKKMLEDAKKKVDELGYLDSLERRFATLDDISVNDILFTNKDAAKRIAGGVDFFQELEKQVTVDPRKFSKAEEISIHDFVEKVLPTAQEVEVLVENRHQGNFVSLIAPVHAEAPSMFKWENAFSWAYIGNITDSMKTRVKEAGGYVDGVLRFSIQWNEAGDDDSDLDAHCIEPDKNEIFFSNCKKPAISKFGGQLDVDIIHPGHQIAVENITWKEKDHMQPGVYKFFVHQYTDRGSRDGFRAEIEFDRQIYQFDYAKGLRTGEDVYVAEVTLHQNGIFTIRQLLPFSASNKEIWGVHTNQFVPVSVIMYSPNYWDGQASNGNRHYFFMLKDCVNSGRPNGFYNEFLKQELMEHKRVFEALGNIALAEETEEQLSGLGFSSTIRNDLLCKVKGSTERILRVKF